MPKKVGDVVTYIDPVGRHHWALLTCVHGPDEFPSVNLVYVTEDTAKQDPYGHQMERGSSIVHLIHQSAQRNCWK